MQLWKRSIQHFLKALGMLGDSGRDRPALQMLSIFLTFNQQLSHFKTCTCSTVTQFIYSVCSARVGMVFPEKKKAG